MTRRSVVVGPDAPTDPASAPDPGAGVPEVTVVLPVRNEAAHIEQVLADLAAQDIEPARVEILVVDGRSDDGTRARVRAVAARDPRVRLLDNPRRWSSAARAIGAAAARGRYVAYIDGHCRIESRAMLSSMVDLFESTGVDCLARPQPLVADAGATPAARAIAAARASAFGHSTRSEIFGATEGPVSPTSSGAMYRRRVFDVVGNYDTAFDACEDVEFNVRVEQAGLRTWSSPRLAVAYEPRGSHAALFRQMQRYGIGRARLHRKHPSAFSIESLVPVAFTLGLPLLLTAGVFASWLPAWLVLLLAAPYMLYAGLALGFAVAASRGRGGWPLVPLIAAAFPVIHVGLGVGYLRGLLRRPRPPVLEEALA